MSNNVPLVGVRSANANNKPDEFDRHKEKHRRRRRWAIVLAVILGASLLALIIMEAIELYNLGRVQQAECPYQESLACWDGNACHAPFMKRVCPLEAPGSLSHGHTAACAAANYICENPVYPEGTCCNQNDFCFLDDPNKTCQSGECVSTDPTLCKGYCTIDDDCANSPWPIPLYEAADQTVFCLNGACVYLVYARTIVEANDMLNETTQLFRNITACIESSCFVVNVDGEDLILCQYVWKCSRWYTFSDQTKKKRDSMDSGTRILHNFTLPAGLSGRLNQEQYNHANEIMNTKLAEHLQSQRNATQLTTST